MNFSQFLAAAHNLRVNCDEMAGDSKPSCCVQHAYEFFGIKRRFSNSSLDSLGSRRPAQAGIKRAPF